MNETLGTSQKLSDLASNAAAQEVAGGAFMEPGAKRQAGRPKGSKTKKRADGSKLTEGNSGLGVAGQTTPSPAVDPISELLPLTDAYAKLWNNFLVMYSEDERAKMPRETEIALSHSAAATMVTFFPDALGKYASLITLVSISGMTFFTAWTFRQENLRKLMAEKAARNNPTKPIMPNGKTEDFSGVAN